MTHQLEPEFINTVLHFLTKEGSFGSAEGVRVLVNEAMLPERTAVFGAQPYERGDSCLGHANGLESNTDATLFGGIDFRAPQLLSYLP